VTETDTEIKRDINRYVEYWQYNCHMSKRVYIFQRGDFWLCVFFMSTPFPK